MIVRVPEVTRSVMARKAKPNGSFVSARKPILKYDPGKHWWYVGLNTTTVASMIFDGRNAEDAENIKKYLGIYNTAESYENIFEEFDPTVDSVGYFCQGNMHWFNLSRVNDVVKEDYLPSGIYKFDCPNGDWIIQSVASPSSDKRVDLSNSITHIESDIISFFGKEDIYKSLDFRFRRGALIYGPPGCGKTFSIIKSIEKIISDRECVVFILTESLRTIDFLSEFKDVLGGRNIIFIIEEITEKLKIDSESYLSFLDGEFSWDMCYTIATTNYPEELENNIVDRPGRFDMMLEVPFPSAEDRRKYFETILKESVDEKVIELTDKFSIAYLKEICLQHRLTSKSLEDVIEGMKKRKEDIKRSFKERTKKLGFVNKEEDDD